MLKSTTTTSTTRYFIFLLSFGLCSCTHLFFQPQREPYPHIDKIGLEYDQHWFQSLDGTLLSAWYFPPQKQVAPGKFELMDKPKGVFFQFHGNAENLTSHALSLTWILKHGYGLVAFDYRGFGASDGAVDIDGVFADSLAALRYAEQLSKNLNSPLILYGQSLGGSLMLKAMQVVDPPIQHVQMVVVESSFYSYHQIAREKLAEFWPTWAIQWMAYLMVTDAYKPGGSGLKLISPIPTLLVYSRRDPIVPIHHGSQLFEELAEPKYFIEVQQPGHIIGMHGDKRVNRKKLLELLAKHPFKQDESESDK